MGYNILIVEDSKLISDNLKKSLGEEAHTVEQAFDYETAVEMIQTHRFDYILLDLILPDGEGEMLLPYAKRAGARVIVMTTDRDSFRRDRLFGFGIVDYIIKERYFDDIIENIRKIFVQVASNSDYTILVVDDSNFIRNNLELLLHSRGFIVLTASNGKEALETMEKYRIDALIADLEMPVIDGFALMSKLRRKKEYKNLPVMILTGSNDSNKIAKVIKHDVKDLIKKPYVIEEMLLKIDNMMNALKQHRIITEERQKFDLYHNAIIHSTLYMKFSPDLHAVYVNERLSQLLFGTSIGEDIRIPLKELIKNPTLEMFRALQKLSPKQPPYNYIFRFDCVNGTSCYISATVSGIFDMQGKMIEMVFIGHDITQLQENEFYLQEQMEEQTRVNLQQQQMMFTQAKMAAMGEMIGNIAHQWRQPLTTLGLLIQDIEDAKCHGELDDTYLHGMVDKSMNQIQFMSKTIDDFRNFFQPDKEKETFNMVETVNKTIDIIDMTLHSYGIWLSVEADEPENYCVFGYKNEMQQVLLNLLNNAKDAICEYRRGNDEDKWIRIALERKDDTVILCVEDNGGGISETIIERVFEPYYTTKDEANGTGIGLYMSKMIIEKNMQGSLRVENRGLGACFQIILPVFDNTERNEA